MKILIYVFGFLSILNFEATASTFQCPKSLSGEFFCKGVAGSHEDMIMKISETRIEGRIHYEYTYIEKDKPADVNKFIASDQGEKNPDYKDMIGTCHQGYYFNSNDGQLQDRTLLNYVNEQGDYDVIRNKGHELFLRCNRVKRE